MINPMYGIIPVGLPDSIAVYIPTIEASIKEAEETTVWVREYLHNFERNKWVQQIKHNYRRNKKKRSRCRPRLR